MKSSFQQFYLQKHLTILPHSKQNDLKNKLSLILKGCNKNFSLTTYRSFSSMQKKNEMHMFRILSANAPLTHRDFCCCPSSPLLSKRVMQVMDRAHSLYSQNKRERERVIESSLGILKAIAQEKVLFHPSSCPRSYIRPIHFPIHL